jgi:hypothetical protein
VSQNQYIKTCKFERGLEPYKWLIPLVILACFNIHIRKSVLKIIVCKDRGRYPPTRTDDWFNSSGSIYVSVGGTVFQEVYGGSSPPGNIRFGVAIQLERYERL